MIKILKTSCGVVLANLEMKEYGFIPIPLTRECRLGHAAILVKVAIYERTYLNASPGPARLLTLSTKSAIITPI